MEMMIQISVSHGEDLMLMFSSCFVLHYLFIFLKSIICYMKPAWKQLRAIMLKNFCAKCMVFVNLSRLNISLNQNEFVTPGRTEISCQ